MKANRAARARPDDVAGAEIIGALILFAIFVATIALLNVTAVPSSGLSAEEDHYESTLNALNGLQAEAEGASDVGATVGRSIELAPSRNVGQDFFSFFLATPARASGELSFEPDYGNLSVVHHRNGNPADFYDLGSATERLPLGRMSFDPHPIFRDAGIVQLENGGVITTNAAGVGSMRFDPPISVSIQGSTTMVTIQARLLNGTGVSLGGTAPVRLGFRTEAATLSTPASNNAKDFTFHVETDHGSAWGEYLNISSAAAGLTAGTQSYVGVVMGSGAAADHVTWIVNGTASGNDILLTTGVAVYDVTVS